MPAVRPMPLLAGLGVACLLAGCGSAGSGSLLSRAAATQLTAQLSQVQSDLASYNCLSAATALANFRNEVGQLQGVNSTLISMLDSGEHTVAGLAARRCPTGALTTTQTRTTTSTPTRTHTMTTVTETTTTVATPTTTAQTGSGSGGAAPTTTTQTSPATTSTQAPAPPPSGGAGLSGSGASGSAPGSSAGGGTP